MRILGPEEARALGIFPVLYRESPVGSFPALQDRLREEIRPDLSQNQDAASPWIVEPDGSTRGLRPSPRGLIIRAAPDVDMGWVGLAMGAAWVLPDQTAAAAHKRSPWLLQTYVSLVDPLARDPVPLVRRTWPAPSGSPTWLGLAVEDAHPPASLRRVQLEGSGSEDALRAVTAGFEAHPRHPDSFHFRFEPPLTLFRVRDQLSRWRQESRATVVELRVSPFVPFALVHELAQIVHASEMVLSIRVDPAAEFWELVRGVESAGTQPPDLAAAAAAAASATVRARSWILRRQQDDGSWARGNGGLAETDPGADRRSTSWGVLALLSPPGPMPETPTPRHQAAMAGLRWLAREFSDLTDAQWQRVPTEELALGVLAQEAGAASGVLESALDARPVLLGVLSQRRLPPGGFCEFGQEERIHWPSTNYGAWARSAAQPDRSDWMVSCLGPLCRPEPLHSGRDWWVSRILELRGVVGPSGRLPGVSEGLDRSRLWPPLPDDVLRRSPESWLFGTLGLPGNAVRWPAWRREALRWVRNRQRDGGEDDGGFVSDPSFGPLVATSMMALVLGRLAAY